LNLTEKHKTILLIDGNNIAYRSFFAIPNLTTSNNIPTNAVYGFVSMLIHTKKVMNPDYMAVCFDSKEKTFRAQDFDMYKAHRKPMPDSLIIQMRIIKEEILKPLGIAFFEKPGFEADDLIGTLTTHFDNLSVFVSILSGDRDMLQLVKDDHVEVISPVSGITETKIFHEAQVKEAYGIHPSQMVDYKSLVGDASDNIQGAPGVGPKTTQKLLEKFGSIKNMLIDTAKDTEKVRNNEDKIRLNQKLISLITDVPISIPTESLLSKSWDVDVMLNILKKYEFKSLIKRIILPTESVPIKITSWKTLCETDWLELNKKTKLSIACSLDGFLYIFDGTTRYRLPLPNLSLFAEDQNKDFLIDLLANKNVLKILFEGKSLLHSLAPLENFFWNEVLDMQLLWYLWKPNAKSYDEKDFIQEFSESEQSLETVLWDAYPTLWEEITSLSLLHVYQKIEFPLLLVLYKMEENGIKIDRSLLASLQQKLGTALVSLQQEINHLAGTEINVLSPKQLSFLLFDKLGLPGQKKTKTGFSTDSDVLSILIPLHPIVSKILQFKELSKIQNTYVESFLKLSSTDSLLHTTYLQAGPATGRISSISPNLQNIPMDNNWGKELRKTIIPRDPQNVFISGDYSQIDLRVMAHFSKDPTLISAFKAGEDIHRSTARLLFQLKPEETVEDWMRNIAKTVNFGILYGMSSHGLSETLKIPERDARHFIDTYFATFIGVKEWIDQTIIETKKKGYVETILGRRRQISELTSSNKMVMQLGERLAVNSIIQGSSADIIKLAMLAIDPKITPFSAILVLQIHDELIIEVKEKDSEKVKQIVQQEMESVLSLLVPLRVHISSGKTLADL
jgi:DNA polymerase-1